MIIVKLSGGLGNQMFQYAAALGLASKKNQKLFIDLSFFHNYDLHEYALKHFNISTEIIEDIGKFNYKIINKYIPTKFHKYIKKIPPYGVSIFKESAINFDPLFFNINDDIYLDGYWQSDKYFKEYEKIVRKEFTFKKPISEINLIIAEKIQSTNSISLHMRRGDYVVNKNTNQMHGICNLDYYYSAINLILSKVNSPYFFIFSDDINWVKSNLKLEAKHLFVEHNSEFDGRRYTANKNHEDIRLMSLCKHNIIANSSFSWWGAWLNQDPGKIVIAPKKWFNNEKFNINDIVPENWLRL